MCMLMTCSDALNEHVTVAWRSDRIPHLNAVQSVIT